MADNNGDPCDPVESYVRPIRSVLFVDDQFPTFGQSIVGAAKETDRARALWRVCTERGWLCDVDNSADWRSPQRQQRLAACDLLVLDYHLVADDSTPALSIIRDLASSEAPNLVVLYTQDQNLDLVLLKAATWARGTRATELISAELEELEERIDWSFREFIAFLSGGNDWKGSLRAATERAGIPLPEDAKCIALIERRLRRDSGAEPVQVIQRIERIGHEDNRWLQCGNLFLVVAGKPSDQEPGEEAAAFLRKLEEAVRQWAPPWLACLVAASRRHVEFGSFRDDALLPEEFLQEGLLGYIGGSSDESERSRRATEIATHILSRRSHSASELLGERLHGKALSTERPALGESALLHLNAFLCSEPFSHHHLRVGSIFAYSGTMPQYWACVTPACDMSPREPNADTNPWAAELDPSRPFLALRLKMLLAEREIRKALKGAEQGRHLFFWDRTRNTERPLVAACFNETTADPNPQVEQMIAADRARISEGGRLSLHRCIQQASETGDARPALEPIVCHPIAQLRAPYAERVVHIVGGHLSRIGVNFVKFRAQT
jgi:hypothetical protein